MFYQPKLGHTLPHNPFNAIVSPRPIGWISTRSADGAANLAPYSFFNAVAYEPPQVMFASTSHKSDQPDSKDTVANIRDTKVFCVNVVAADATHAMNTTAAEFAKTVDEFEQAEIAKAPCTMIACDRVADAPAALECTLTDIVRLPGAHNHLVLGEVVGIHMRDDCVVDGLFDPTTFVPLARMGYRDYTRIERVFTLDRPDET